MKIRKLIFALIKLILDKTNQIQTHFRHVYLQRAIKVDGGEKKHKKKTRTHNFNQPTLVLLQPIKKL